MIDSQGRCVQMSSSKSATPLFQVQPKLLFFSVSVSVSGLNDWGERCCPEPPGFKMSGDHIDNWIWLQQQIAANALWRNVWQQQLQLRRREKKSTNKLRSSTPKTKEQRHGECRHTVDLNRNIFWLNKIEWEHSKSANGQQTRFWLRSACAHCPTTLEQRFFKRTDTDTDALLLRSTILLA
jgi:hypothetical protein